MRPARNRAGEPPMTTTPGGRTSCGHISTVFFLLDNQTEGFGPSALLVGGGE